jgi:tetratricopeptide (TPR) repeat protein
MRGSEFFSKKQTGTVHEQIAELCEEGDALASAGRLDDARQKYIAALKLLPGEPRHWEAATWIYVALGDVHFRSQNFDKAFKCFYNAVQCPKGLGNPYIHLRLGQLYLELGDVDKAADELTRAYMGGGINIFMADDPKYLEFLETRISL